MIFKKRGLTILELMAVFAIIGILAAIAYPLIMDYLAKTRRHEAESSLLVLSSNMERYFSQHNTYQTATIGTGNQDTDISSENQFQNKYYKFDITEKTNNGFVLMATPINQQATTDQDCGALTINEKGIKGITGHGDVGKCWGSKG